MFARNRTARFCGVFLWLLSFFIVVGKGHSAVQVRFEADCLAERITINPRDGSLRYGETDFEMNPMGFALLLRRYYCSAETGAGVFGQGWTSVFDRRLERSGEGMVLCDEWGNKVEFKKGWGSLYHSATGRPQQLMIDAEGALLRDWRGKFWSFDPKGHLTGIYNASMCGLNIEYNEGKISRICDDFGRSIQFETDRAGRIVEARTSSGDFRRYEYDRGFLVRVSDRSGVLSEYFYDSKGRLVAVTLLGKERAVVSYDGIGRVRTISGPGVPRRAVSYREIKVPFPARLTEIADAFGNVMRYRFRDNPPECQITLPAGGAATIAYNERRLPVSIDLPGGRRIRMSYDGSGNLTGLVVPGGRGYSFSYTGRGDLRRWTRLDGTVFSFEWQGKAGARVCEIQGARPSDVRRIGFDGEGRLAWFAQGRQRAILFSRDARGDLSRIVPRDGRSGLLINLDEASRIARIALPGRPAFQAIYGLGGHLLALSDSVGYRLSFLRDRLGRLSGIEDCEGRRETFERNRWGRPTLWRGPDGSEGRFVCDIEGNLVEIRPPGGGIARYRYGERDLATSETRLGAWWELKYDEFGAVVQRRGARPGGLRIFYDPMGWPAKLVRAAQKTVRFQCGPDGKIQRISGDGCDFRFGVDSAGRPARVADAANRTWAQWELADSGRVKALSTSAGRWTYEYDERGRLVVLTAGGREKFRVRYEYENPQSRLPSRVLLPGGTTVAYTYDAYGRPSSIRAVLPSGKTALSERYRYDGRGNIVAVESSGSRTEWEYDARNRLVAERRDGHLYARIRYGADGRILAIAGESGDVEFVYDAEGKVVRSSRARFDYDVDGNISGRRDEKGLVRFEFDSTGRLTGVETSSGIVRYRYSPNGWLIGRDSRGRSARWFFLGDLPLFGALRGGRMARWFPPDPFRGRPPLGSVGEAAPAEIAFADGFGRLRAVGGVGGEPLRRIVWDLLGPVVGGEGDLVFAPVSVEALSFDAGSGLSGDYDLETGLALSPRSFLEHLFSYAGSAARPPLPVWASRAAGAREAEPALIEETAACCAAGRFAPEEGALLRYIIASLRSPGWPDAGGDETFDSILDGHSFLAPAEIARRITETVFRDATGGLSPAILRSHAAVPARWSGLGGFRAICPTLSILPPVVLERGFVRETVWRDDPCFGASDDAVHGWIGRLLGRSSDFSGVRIGDDGCLRLAGELLELVRWGVEIGQRPPDRPLPQASERPARDESAARRRARCEKFFGNLASTP